MLAPIVHTFSIQFRRFGFEVENIMVVLAMIVTVIVVIVIVIVVVVIVIVVVEVKAEIIAVVVCSISTVENLIRKTVCRIYYGGLLDAIW